MTGRRILALVLPDLLVEIVRGLKSIPASRALAVVVERPLPSARDRIVAVDDVARGFGVRIGQTVAEAHATTAELRVERITRAAVESVLEGILELARNYGTQAGFSRSESELPDTVWVDVSGSASLFGGESALAAELKERVRQFGHVARVVVAPGPIVARALGLYGRLPRDGVRLVDEREVQKALAPLPLRALLDEERVVWFARVGLLTIEALVALPRSEVSARLGADAPRFFEIAEGRDTTPLVETEIARRLAASQDWDEPIQEVSAVLFAARGLFARLSARLEARGEAATRLLCELLLEGGSSHPLAFTFSAPIWREGEFERILAARLERFEATRAIVGVSIQLPELVPARSRQLGIVRTRADEEQELPLLLAELTSELGEDAVGRLVTVDSHRPEERSQLIPWEGTDKPVSRSSGRKSSSKRAPRAKSRSALRLRKETDRVTRVFPHPLRVSTTFGVGHEFVWGRRLFCISRIELAERLESVEWWTEHATSRDYFWVWLRSERETLCTEVLVYLDRRTREYYLQALVD